MNQSQINFIVKTLGADEAAREFQKIERAAQKAGMTMKAFTKTAAGEQQLMALQTKAATARANEQTSATDRQASALDRASRSQASYFGHIAKTTVQSALINKLFLEMVDVSGQAVQQVDLMQNFPATMRSMGESTEDANAAFQSLSKYVGEVGGNLGDATSYVTRFTGATKDVKAATAIFVGLNNALIAGDSSLEEQRQAAIQFAQSLERGKPDMREWRTLTQNMSFQLDQVAKSMGYVNANELGEALTQGEESMAAFTTALNKDVYWYGTNC
jgi:tape measure domain-containing protein